MDIRELNQIDFRYVRIRLDGQTERYENDNFTALLEYIGRYYPINDKEPIGCAYVKIRKETDKLLQVSWGHNWKLKTSKREVSSIRFAKYNLVENKKNHYYIRIPYKISFIFTAVINIVAEIAETQPIPENLKWSIGKAYGRSFYALHMEEYDSMYELKFKEDAYSSDFKKNPSKLHSEFHSTSSVFKRIFP